MSARTSACFTVCIALALASGVANAQEGPATSAGVSADNAAAARRVMMDALQHAGNHGGCHPLPAGWSSLSAAIVFPKSYGGYGAWVNTAELLPVSGDLARFLKSKSPGPFNQPAWGNSSRIETHLCAPAGFTYWLVADSGTARVAIGRVSFARAGSTYHATFTAPPLGGTTGSGSQNTGTAQPRSPAVGSGYKPPTTDKSWKPPTTDNSWKPPTTDNSWSPPP